MAIIFPTLDLIILEVPRTGSKWLHKAAPLVGIPWKHVGSTILRGHGDLADHNGDYKYYASFVRDPADWLASYYARRHERGWRTHFHLDSMCESDTFERFAECVFLNLPGFIGDLFSRFTGPPNCLVEFVGKYEALENDFRRLFLKFDIDIPLEPLKAIGRINRSNERPIVSEYVRFLMGVSELSAITNYNYEQYYPVDCTARDILDSYPNVGTDIYKLARWTHQIHETKDRQRANAGTPTSMSRRRARLTTNYGLYCRLKLYDKNLAARYFEHAVTCAPYHPRSLTNLADYQVEKGNLDRAHKLYKKAVAQNPFHTNSLSLYAYFLSVELCEDQQAMVFYERAVVRDDCSTNTITNYASLLCKYSNKKKRANELFQLALKREPDSKAALQGLYYIRQM